MSRNNYQVIALWTAEQGTQEHHFLHVKQGNTSMEREAPKGKSCCLRPQNEERPTLTSHHLLTPPAPAAWLASCRGLNSQLRELWHSRGCDLEAQLAAFALSPCPWSWCPAPSRTRHPGAPLSLGWDSGIHTRLLWNTSGGLWSSHSQQRSSPGADVLPT